MSTALAIGAVTAVLRSLLDNRLASAFGALGEATPVISVLPPDLVIPTDTGTSLDTLNLFLYQVRPNLGWRNVGYPARDSGGDRVSYPPLALDLHYLLSAYSQEPFRAEIMLGYSMQVLHETGVLPRPLIRNRLRLNEGDDDNNSGQDSGIEMFANSTLADQIELLKIAPISLSTEEISKLWAAFQTNYRPTVAYQVSVVLIESDRPDPSALPVQDRQVLVMPFKRPVINAVEPQIISPGDLLTIQGHNLRAETISVRFDGNPQFENTPPESVTNTEISIVPPPELQAGVKTVQVAHFVDFTPDEETEDLRKGSESNTVPFILRPQITSPLPTTITQGELLTLSITPSVGERQRVTLLLGDLAIAPEQPSADDPLPPDTVQFPIPAELLDEEQDSEIYPVRVRVDGAESALQPNEDGLFEPRITVTTSPG